MQIFDTLQDHILNFPKNTKRMLYKSNILRKHLKVLIKKELFTFINTPIGYIFSAFFVLLLNFLFFFGLGKNSFWDLKSASMEQFFLWIPILFIIFIPAITMRLWSEEDRNGTLEILLTLPYENYELVLGKFLAALIFICLALLTTILTPLTVIILGNPDKGLILSGYFGSLLLAASYISIGLVVSSLNRDQITAYVLTLLSCLVFFLMGYQPILQFFGYEFGELVTYLSLSSHFESFRIGILNLRDFVYLLSFISLLLGINVIILRTQKS
jgi:ABC-2 type transport system permease protein